MQLCVSCKQKIDGPIPIYFREDGKIVPVCSLKCLQAHKPDLEITEAMRKQEEIRPHLIPRNAIVQRTPSGFETIKRPGPFDIELAHAELELERKQKEFQNSKLFRLTKADFDKTRRTVTQQKIEHDKEERRLINKAKRKHMKIKLPETLTLKIPNLDYSILKEVSANG